MSFSLCDSPAFSWRKKCFLLEKTPFSTAENDVFRHFKQLPALSGDRRSLRNSMMFLLFSIISYSFLLISDYKDTTF